MVIIGTTSCAQQTIKNLIKDDLNSRYTNVEIVSMTQDSCPNMNNLFQLSLTIMRTASKCKLNISTAFLSYGRNEINLDKTKEFCKKEIDQIDALTKSWDNTYFSKSEKCLLVKYRYGNSDGIKTTMVDYYSLDENNYKEGNYPYLHKEYNADYGIKFYKDVVKTYTDFLLEIAND